MSHENVEVVCDQFAATNERDFARAMSHYAEDVQLVVDADAFLERGTFKGRDAVGQWFVNWFTTFEPGYHFDTGLRGGKIVRVELYLSRAAALEAAGLRE